MAQPHTVNLFYLIKYTICYYLPSLTRGYRRVSRKLLIFAFGFVIVVQNPPSPLCPGLLCRDRVQISLCKEADAPGQMENKNASPEDSTVLATDPPHPLATPVSPSEAAGAACRLWRGSFCHREQPIAPSVTLEQNRLGLSPLVSLWLSKIKVIFPSKPAVRISDRYLSFIVLSLLMLRENFAMSSF